MTKPKNPPPPVRAFSFGGGVQSVACLVLAAQGRIDYKTFLFAHVGDDSEDPRTLKYLHEVAIPYAEQHGLTIKTLQKTRRNGSVETLFGRITSPGSKAILIPVRQSKTGKPANRACTADFKVGVVVKEVRAMGASKKHPATVGIGISLDEFQRMRTNSDVKYQVLDYPLIEMRLTRQDCKNIILAAGLPVPPKSSCFFCPWHSIPAWEKLYDERKDLFDKAVNLERHLNDRLAKDGYAPVYLTDHGWKFRLPLDQIVTGAHQTQESAFTHDEASDTYSCGPFTCAIADGDAA